MDFESLKDSGLNVDDHVLKLATALSGVAADILVTWGMPSDKSNALVTAITIITVLLIAGISHVQANKLKAQGVVAAAAKTPSATPAVQFNTDSTVSNQPKASETPPVDPQQQLVEAVYAQVMHPLEARAQALAKARAAANTPAPQPSTPAT